jgi:hypothetical protein
LTHLRCISWTSFRLLVWRIIRYAVVIVSMYSDEELFLFALHSINVVSRSLLLSNGMMQAGQAFVQQRYLDSQRYSRLLSLTNPKIGNRRDNETYILKRRSESITVTTQQALVSKVPSLRGKKTVVDRHPNTNPVSIIHDDLLPTDLILDV